MSPSYRVIRRSDLQVVDATWDKPFWRSVSALTVDQAHVASSVHHPLTRVKLAYGGDALSVIFQVEADFLRAEATCMHGPVWEDSCVEFFFSPYRVPSTAYYNLEINCCGVLLMQHHEAKGQGTRFIDAKLCRSIEIASSLSGPEAIQPTVPTCWTLEYRLPLTVFADDPAFVPPGQGVIWRANVYKCADASAYPHWLSWSPVPSEQPDFHRPDAFGTFVFA